MMLGGFLKQRGHHCRLAEGCLHDLLNVILTGHTSDLTTDNGCHLMTPAIHNIYESIASWPRFLTGTANYTR
jgi:hypothetical protein